MYTPWINEVLGVQPISLEHWSQLLVIALSVLVVIEAHKWLRARIAK
jgi:Ca2+-transporting ATPase